MKQLNKELFETTKSIALTESKCRCKGKADSMRQLLNQLFPIYLAQAVQVTDKPYKPTWWDNNKANTIYIKPQPEYGFQININHPEIRQYYIQFRRECNIPYYCPLENCERLGFERLVLCGYYPIKLKRA